LFLKEYLPGKVSLQTLAEEITSKCQTQKDRPSCYDKEIPLLMDPPYSLSMEEAFNLTHLIQNKDDKYVYCHVLGHELASREVTKNPSSWTSIIPRCPTGVCSNGCIHGALTEKFRYKPLNSDEVEQIKPKLKSICHLREDWQPTQSEQNACHHALGHLFMYLTNADIPKAVNLCSEISVSKSGEPAFNMCLHGVFMQIFQPLKDDDIYLVQKLALSKNTAYDFCSQFSENAKSICWMEAWSLWIKELRNPSGLTAFCSKLGNSYIKECYLSFFYLMPIQLKFDTNNMLQYCNSVPEELKGECAGLVALRLVSTTNIDRALNFCASSSFFDNKQKCYEMLTQNALFYYQRNTEEFNQICQNLPENWKEKCLNSES